MIADHHLEANILALLVAVEPQDEVVYALALALQKVDDALLLRYSLHGRSEEGRGVCLVPALVRAGKISAEYVADHGSDLHQRRLTACGVTKAMWGGKEGGKEEEDHGAQGRPRPVT